MESIILICRAARSGSNGQRFRTDAGRVFCRQVPAPQQILLPNASILCTMKFSRRKTRQTNGKDIPWRTDRNSRTAEPHRNGRTAEPHRNGRAAEPHRSSRTAEPHRSGRIAESHRNGRTDKAHRNSEASNPNRADKTSSPGSPSALQEHRGFRSSC